MRLSVRMLLPLIVFARLFAAPVAVGVIRSTGEFRLDSFLVPGNATLFEGSVVETTRASSEIRLAGGFTMTLAPESRATIYRDRTMIGQGSVLMRDSGRQMVEAQSLRVSSPAKPSLLQISISQLGHVLVFASTGEADVRTSSGAMVARVLPGNTMDFSPQAAPPDNSVKLSGCLAGKAGAYFLTDATSKITIELLGPNLGRFVDTRVEVAGAMVPGFTPAGGADHAVMASEVKSLGPCVAKPVTPAAGRGGAGNPGPVKGAAGGGGGISSLGVVAIVGGVAVAAAVGGLAASGTFDGASPASPK